MKNPSVSSKIFISELRDPFFKIKPQIFLFSLTFLRKEYKYFWRDF